MDAQIQKEVRDMLRRGRRKTIASALSTLAYVVPATIVGTLVLFTYGEWLGLAAAIGVAMVLSRLLQRLGVSV